MVFNLHTINIPNYSILAKEIEEGGVRMKLKSTTIIISFILTTFGSFSVANALNMSFDQIIWQSDSGMNPANLGASVSMVSSADQLIITLTNTTTNYSSANDLPATAILTGIGFNLPGGLTIEGGSVAYTNYYGSVNPSTVWGYDGSVSTGPFANIATLPVDIAVSTLSAAVETPFLAGGNIDGPRDGVLPASYSGPIGPNYGYFSPTAIITLNLSGDLSAADLAYIDNHPIVVAFGSPTAPVSEPSTILLLGSGLLGLWGFRRKFK